MERRIDEYRNDSGRGTLYQLQFLSNELILYELHAFVGFEDQELEKGNLHGKHGSFVRKIVLDAWRDTVLKCVAQKVVQSVHHHKRYTDTYEKHFKLVLKRDIRLGTMCVVY